MSKRKDRKGIIFFCCVILLVLVTLYSGVQILESTVLRSGEGGTTGSKTVTVDGVEYFPRQDINVLMVLGIDRYGPVEPSEYYRNGGAADMIMLLIFDEKNEQCNVLYLNRDTMLNINVLGLDGNNAGSTYGQLALAHTYGTGMDDSCVNVRDTVSAFLGGVNIDYYISMNMDAIAILNDAVGGVTVNVEDDFSEVDPSIGMGRVTLDGPQAINFVRTRKDVGDQLNLSRIERQEAYVTAFTEAFKQTNEGNDEFIADLYDQILPYIVTDCSVNTISGMMNRYTDYEIMELVTPQGENVLGEEYYEFYADEDALKDLVLELFYAPK
jgi:LCP family protein required for cell wall assembly